MKLSELFNEKIMDASDDFVITQDGQKVVDNRERIDENIKYYLDRDVKRIYYSEAAHALKIRLQGTGVQE